MKNLLVLFLLAAPAFAQRAVKPALVRVPPTAVFLITPKTDLRMIRASMPELLKPAIHDPATGEAARASFEAMVKRTATEKDETIIAFRYEDKVALVPARPRADEVVGPDTGLVAMAKLGELDSPRTAVLAMGPLYRLQTLLSQGDVGKAMRALESLFVRAP